MRWVQAAMVLVVLVAMSCASDSGELDVGDVTWAAACQDDTDCGGGAFCRCELCARGCSGSGECGKGFACVDTTALSAERGCDEEAPLPSAMCLPDECGDDGDCATGFICEADVCTVGER